MEPRLAVKWSRATLNWSMVALGDGGIGRSATFRPAVFRLAGSRLIAWNDCCRAAASGGGLVNAALPPPSRGLVSGTVPCDGLWPLREGVRRPGGVGFWGRR